jgi:hypothetical protein
MKTCPFHLLLTVAVLCTLIACSKSDEKSPVELAENEFTVQPEYPRSTDEVKLITYDCQYNQFGGIVKKGYTIEVVKRFNSMMKLPCILEYDTISLGNLQPGTYQLTLTLVDLSTALLADTIAHRETQTLVVKP